ncbi:MAG: hypothetical protein ABR540_21215 [Acidimicrobiales bacterium]
MADDVYDLSASVAELDDDYLSVLLLLSVRRATSEEPRRAGFWHALAATLSAEQDKRRGSAELLDTASPGGLQPDDRSELEAVLAELRRDVETLEAEVREFQGG